MSTALVWLHKEWLAQWRLLASYLGLAMASIAIVCLGLPTETWRDSYAGVNALGWFVASGVVGVVLFVAPMLVRGEFAPKDDQFLRRLPGALAPAAAGKLAFLVMLGLGLPLLSLLLGELVLAALGVNWDGIFAISPEEVGTWPYVGVASIVAFLLAPWVASVGTWMPRGRLAAGGTVLLVLLVGIVVVSLLRLCPGLDATLEWRPLLWLLWPAGMLLFLRSLCGRRGGGSWRSAMHGLAALAAIVAIPGAWFGNEVWRYRCPDPETMRVGAYGVSPDGQKVLLNGSGHPQCHVGAGFALDVASGEVTQLTAIWSSFSPTQDLWSPDARVRRWWWKSDGERERLFDLVRGEWHDVLRDSSGVLHAGELREAIAAELRATAPFRMPDGCRAWRDGQKLCIEQADGSVREVSWPAGFGYLTQAAGHGFRSRGAEMVLYDLQQVRIVPTPKGTEDAMQVRDRWLVAFKRGAWQRLDVGDGSMSPIAELAGSACQGLVDDDRALFRRSIEENRNAEWFVYRPADGRIEPVLGDGGDAKGEMTLASLSRDAMGRTWLAQRQVNDDGEPSYLALDPATLRVESLPVAAGRAFALLGNDVFTVEEERRIVRTDYTTGARTVLYPRSEREAR